MSTITRLPKQQLWGFSCYLWSLGNSLKCDGIIRPINLRCENNCLEWPGAEDKFVLKLCAYVNNFVLTCCGIRWFGLWSGRPTAFEDQGLNLKLSVCRDTCTSRYMYQFIFHAMMGGEVGPVSDWAGRYKLLQSLFLCGLESREEGKGGWTLGSKEKQRYLIYFRVC